MSEPGENPQNPGGRVAFFVIVFALLFAALGGGTAVFGIPTNQGIATTLGSIIGAIIAPALIGMGVGYLVGKRM